MSTISGCSTVAEVAQRQFAYIENGYWNGGVPTALPADPIQFGRVVSHKNGRGLYEDIATEMMLQAGRLGYALSATVEMFDDGRYNWIIKGVTSAK